MKFFNYQFKCFGCVSQGLIREANSSLTTLLSIARPDGKGGWIAPLYYCSAHYADALEGIKQDKQDIEIDKLKKLINQSPSDKNNNDWNQEKVALEKQIQDLKSQNNHEELKKEIDSLKQLVEQLEKEVNELRAEVQDLKKESNNSPEYQVYLAKKESELQSKQLKLNQLKGVVEVDDNKMETSKYKKSDNNLLTISSVAGVAGAVLVFIGLLVILIIAKTKTRKIK